MSISKYIPFSQRINRRGAATVELAVCLPVFAVLVFGSVEAANMIYIKQALTEAAYEGAKVASTTGSEEDNARNRIDDILEAYDITPDEVSITPSFDSNLERGTRMVITITASTAENTYVSGWIPVEQLRASVTMNRL
ncbi:TadE/TadG family type IV pilus assembly protein [Calycomorphotria hydatis]|uniref:TadE-like protein n=1 Tax=Calycomorphotria hydatis TaxID=2528027 RepID=A0A517T3N5_9PLAN|nr:TadE/TadG family type IV pilus assembly protein [Calycomorphotria hydatis]QDT62988.1 TadE-like protein [Calycomorphotria hydatis]